MPKLTYLGADGEAATFGNTGFDQIDITSSGSSMVFENNWMPRGRISLLCTATANEGKVFGRKDIPAATNVSVDIPYSQLVLPNAESTIMYFGAGETRAMQLNLWPDGIIRIRNVSNATSASSPLGTVVAGEKYVLSAYLKQNDADGHARAVLFEEDGTTVVWDSGMVTGQNFGSLAITRMRLAVGKTGTTSTIVATNQWGEPRWEVGTSNILPAWSEHHPYFMWVDGAYVPVYVWYWDGTTYIEAV